MRAVKARKKEAFAVYSSRTQIQGPTGRAKDALQQDGAEIERMPIPVIVRRKNAPTRRAGNQRSLLLVSYMPLAPAADARLFARRANEQRRQRKPSIAYHWSKRAARETVQHRVRTRINTRHLKKAAIKSSHGNADDASKAHKRWPRTPARRTSPRRLPATNYNPSASPSAL